LFAQAWIEKPTMYQLTRMRLSRDDWKEKARIRGEQLREWRKSLRRQKKALDELRRENALLKEGLSKKATNH
jgi:hypothetical protein